MLQVGEPEDGRCTSWHLIRYNHDDDVGNDNHDDINDDVNDDNHVIKLDDPDGGDDVWVISKHGKKVPS